MVLAFSVDLEPNKDGSFDGVAEAMDWYDAVVPRGTVYATHRIATERPEIVDRLAADHEIGVHVHPREFGHEEDDLAALPPEQQRELITETRSSVASAAELSQEDISAFRAGRHKASTETLSILADLGFELDASVNVRYRDHMPESVTDRVGPFVHESGIIELPTTYGRPRLVSRVGVRAGLSGTITATANTLRTDKVFCDGFRAVSWLLNATPSVVSMYMHPYDATDYHSNLENNGSVFRDRIERLVKETERRFVAASHILDEASRDSTHSGG